MNDRVNNKSGFAHHQLYVYGEARAFLRLVHRQPLGSAELRNQAHRASTSVVLNIAEAASHEMGHNMGLSHDGTSSLTYYGGHGATASSPSWGPIMGTGYGRNVSQWSKSTEYYDGNQAQDDFK